MIYLSDADISIVREILKAHVPHTKVLVFGSRVKGNIKPHSDLDLCIMGDTPLSLQELGLLREAFSESDLPIRVDVVEWGAITPEFQNIIMQKSEAIQS